MFGMLGSLLGSATSGLFGMLGQSSANEAAQEAYGSRYQTSVKDMTKAGLNPAAMFGSGMAGVGAPPVPQNTMQAPAAALKDAASSAVQMNIADKTIDQLTEQIAKMKAEEANIRAGTPGVEARSTQDVLRTDAIKRIPTYISDPIYQGGLGARELSPAGKIPSSAAAAAAAGGAAVRKLPEFSSLPTMGSAKGVVRAIKDKYESFPRITDAEREAARQRNARRWGWLTGAKPSGSTQYQQ